MGGCLSSLQRTERASGSDEANCGSPASSCLSENTIIEISAPDRSGRAPTVGCESHGITLATFRPQPVSPNLIKLGALAGGRHCAAAPFGERTHESACTARGGFIAYDRAPGGAWACAQTLDTTSTRMAGRTVKPRAWPHEDRSSRIDSARRTASSEEENAISDGLARTKLCARFRRSFAIVVCGRGGEGERPRSAGSQSLA